MISTDWWSLLVIGSVLLFLAILISSGRNFRISYEDEERHQWLGREIAQRGGTIRVVHRLSAHSDRFFVIEFTNTKGEVFHTKCEIVWDRYNQRIVWSTDPSDLMPNNDTRLDSPRPSAAVLQQLNSPLRYERLTAVFALAKLDALPADVYGRLAQMAVEDDDPQVREEAKAIVRRS
jgi:hypothetical protein